MIKIIADMHTHNGEVCNHATGSIDEMLQKASERGLFAIANTDHGPGFCFDGEGKQYYLDNLKRPETLYGVRLFCGIEANIRDYDGQLDMKTDSLKQLDWVIASMHGGFYPFGNSEENTLAYMNVLENPAVDCLGHIERSSYAVDYERVIVRVKEKGRTIEINNHSFDFQDTDLNRCCEIAGLCMKYELPVVISSDAHSVNETGSFPHCMDFLESIDFPEDLIINADVERLLSFMDKRIKQKALIGV